MAKMTDISSAESVVDRDIEPEIEENKETLSFASQ